MENPVESVESSRAPRRKSSVMSSSGKGLLGLQEKEDGLCRDKAGNPHGVAMVVVSFALMLLAGLTLYGVPSEDGTVALAGSGGRLPRVRRTGPPAAPSPTSAPCSQGGRRLCGRRRPNTRLPGLVGLPESTPVRFVSRLQKNAVRRILESNSPDRRHGSGELRWKSRVRKQGIPDKSS